VGLAVLPRLWCGRDAARWYEGDAASARAHGRAVSRQLEALDVGAFSTGSRRFDGEWRFGTAVMAALGFGQTALAHPELAPWATGEMDRALADALSPSARTFDTEAWGEDALETLSGSRGHAAYLGYLNLALSLRRHLGPPSPHEAVGKRISETLARRLAASPSLVVETYPAERYPVDNAAGVASLALRARASGARPDALVERWLEQARQSWLERSSGLLHQAVDEGGRPADAPRGSGSALAAYFLSFAGTDLSGELHWAVRRELGGAVLGFGVVREYSPGWKGSGDIDSGPLVLGWSISAMGFSLGSARAHHDERAFAELYRAFHLFGAPRWSSEELSFVSGGPLGDAIVFAMLTALPAERWRGA